MRTSLEEELPLTNLRTIGEIPAWLKGTLIRNGPSKFESGNNKVYHWFDGLAMLHAFSFEKGEVSYTNRFLRSDAYKTVFDQGSFNYMGFMSDPCRSLFRRVLSTFFPKPEIPNANVNIGLYFKQHVALTETPLPVCFDPVTLKTLGGFLYQDDLPKANIWESAHPHYGLQGVYNLMMEFGARSHYVLWKMGENSGERKVVARLEVEKPSYMHTFSVTKNYFILTEYPLVINPLHLLTGKGFIQNFRWEPELGTRVHVIERASGQKIYSHKMAPFFSFHHVNAYESGSDILLDLIAYADDQVITDLASYGEGKSIEPPSKLIRLTLSPSKISEKILFDIPFELPRIYEALDGLSYRYLYATDLREGVGRTLYKLDVDQGTFLTWETSSSQPGEPIFVKAPDSQTEDEGVLLSIVLEKDSCYLLILDAKTFQEKGRAIVPHLIPVGLHGSYLSS